MNAVVMDGATVGQDNFVAAMAFVKAGEVRTLVAGMPARIVRELTDQEIAWKRSGTREYRGTARRRHTELVPCEPLRVVGPIAAGLHRLQKFCRYADRGRLMSRDAVPTHGRTHRAQVASAGIHATPPGLAPADSACYGAPTKQGGGGGVQPILRLDPVSKTFPGVHALDSVQFDAAGRGACAAGRTVPASRR